MIQQIKDGLKRLDLTYSWLSRQLGVSPATITLWMNESIQIPDAKAVEALSLLRRLEKAMTKVA